MIHTSFPTFHTSFLTSHNSFPTFSCFPLTGTIQFSSAVQLARHRLSTRFPGLAVPKCKPLSPGEVLGCTAPVISRAAQAIVFLADGR